MAAVGRLAANPPAGVGKIQRLSSRRLLRPYPLGLRFSGKNMTPLPAWLAGAHFVALNMSNNDLATQLHFALFNGSEGFVLKPPEMHRPKIDSSKPPTSPRLSQPSTPLSRLKREPSRDDYAEATENQDWEGSFCPSKVQEGPAEEQEEDQETTDAFWPPWREQVACATIEVLSLHNCPKRGESRPLFNGRRSRCHQYHQELSGFAVASQDALSMLSRTSVTTALYAIGGFCAIGRHLPLKPHDTSAEASLATADLGGLNAHYAKTIHCIAAEPHATFLRLGVNDGKQEVAYTTVVMGRLRRGYRVFRLRSLLGTHIEMAYLLVHVDFGSELNAFNNARLQRMQNCKQLESLKEKDERIHELHSELGRWRGDKQTQRTQR